MNSAVAWGQELGQVLAHGPLLKVKGRRNRRPCGACPRSAAGRAA